MFFGRESQIEQMMALWDKRVSSLVTCRRDGAHHLPHGVERLAIPGFVIISPMSMKKSAVHDKGGFRLVEDFE